ncbi:MAG: hypothetical protein DHS20C01_18050 [marine bacterium B5-7]|nr:MAG: hypothetical protein DHS20C01_18050 [marine bacterium B5-7]
MHQLMLFSVLLLVSLVSSANTCNSGYSTSYSTVQTTGYGGVSLNVTAELLLQATDIEGAAYDPGTGQIIFYGESPASLPSMNMDDVVVAVRSIYGLGEKPAQSPGVSINTEPSQIPDKVKVRYDGDTENTEFGRVMFEADRLLKSLTMGFDNMTGVPMSSDVPGFRSYAEIINENNQRQFDSKEEALQWAERELGDGAERIWIEPEKITLSRSDDGDSMVFDQVEMRVYSAHSGEGETTDHTAEFAEFLTQNYDLIANEYPVFKELKRLGKITAVVKWIQENNIPLDLSFIEGYEPAYTQTPDHTNAIRVRSTIQLVSPSAVINTSYSMQGGVDFTLNEGNFSQIANIQAADIMNNALDARPTEQQFEWSFNNKGKNYLAIAQSLHRGKKDGNFQWRTEDASYPTPGDLSLNLTRYYDSFNTSNEGFGPGWYATPFGIRQPGVNINILFINKTTGEEYVREAFLEIIFRSGSQEERYTLVGVNADGYVRYESEDKRNQILFDHEDHEYRLTTPGSPVITLDPTGKLTSIKDNNGLELTYGYTTISGKLVLSRISHGSGRQITFEHDSLGHIARLNHPGQIDTSYRYDDLHRLTGIKFNDIEQTTYHYDENNRLSIIRDALGQVITQADYDDYNRVVDREIGSNAKQIVDFNLSARKSEIEDLKGLKTTQYYDDQYRPLTRTDNLNRQVDFVYGAPFGPTTIVDPRSATTHINYDALGNPHRIETADGQHWRTFYSDKNRVVFSENPLQQGMRYQYDDQQQLTDVFYNVVSLQGEEGFSEGDYSYDSTNKTHYDYDNVGNVIKVTDAFGQSWTSRYNNDGQVIESTDPAGRTLSYNYDQYGRLTDIRDALGMLEWLTYDAFDRVIQRNTRAGQQHYEYNLNHQLIAYTDGRGSTSRYNYDSDGRMTQVIDALGGITQYHYDEHGQFSGITLPNGEQQSMQYDIASRLIRESAGQ